MRLMRIITLAVAAMIASAAGVQAQQFVPHHEVSLSVGTTPVSDYFTTYDYYPGPDYVPMSYKGPRYTCGVWTAAYGYNFSKWLYVGGGVSWYSEFSSVYSNVDNSKQRKDSYSLVSVMPTVRFSWLNRKWVRMYSTIGFGLSIETERHEMKYTTRYVGSKFTPVGIMVGRSFYGFAELSIGTQGFAIAGFGYRFNAKKVRQ